MDTLSPKLWQSNFKSKEDYLEYRARFKQLYHAGKFNHPVYFFVDAILRGRNWKKGFTLSERKQTFGYNIFDPWTGCVSECLQVIDRFNKTIIEMYGEDIVKSINFALKMTFKPKSVDDWNSMDAYDDEVIRRYSEEDI